MRRYSGLVFAALFVFLVSVVVYANSWEEVARLSQAGQHERALQIVRNLREKEPYDYNWTELEARVWHNYGIDLWEKGDEEKARVAYREAARLLELAVEQARDVGADNEVVRDLLLYSAYLYFDIDDLAGTRRNLNTILMKWPDDVEALALFGQTYIREFNFNPVDENLHVAWRGVEFFEKAIELNGGTNPKYYIPDAYFYVGFVRLEDGDVETAKAYLQLAYDLYTVNSQSPVAQSRMRMIAEALQELNAQ